MHDVLRVDPLERVGKPGHDGLGLPSAEHGHLCPRAGGHLRLDALHHVLEHLHHGPVVRQNDAKELLVVHRQARRGVEADDVARRPAPPERRDLAGHLLRHPPVRPGLDGLDDDRGAVAAPVAGVEDGLVIGQAHEHVLLGEAAVEHGGRGRGRGGRGRRGGEAHGGARRCCVCVCVWSAIRVSGTPVCLFSSGRVPATRRLLYGLPPLVGRCLHDLPGSCVYCSLRRGVAWGAPRAEPTLVAAWRAADGELQQSLSPPRTAAVCVSAAGRAYQVPRCCVAAVSGRAMAGRRGTVRQEPSLGRGAGRRARLGRLLRPSRADGRKRQFMNWPTALGDRAAACACEKQILWWSVVSALRRTVKSRAIPAPHTAAAQRSTATAARSTGACRVVVAATAVCRRRRE